MKNIKLNNKLKSALKKQIKGESCDALLSEELTLVCDIMRKADYSLNDKSTCIITKKAKENVTIKLGAFSKILVLNEISSSKSLCIYTQFKPQVVILSEDEKSLLDYKKKLGITELKPKEIIIK